MFGLIITGYWARGHGGIQVYPNQISFWARGNGGIQVWLTILIDNCYIVPHNNGIKLVVGRVEMERYRYNFNCRESVP